MDEVLTKRQKLQDQEGLCFQGGVTHERRGGEVNLCRVLILCYAHSDNLAFCLSLI